MSNGKTENLETLRLIRMKPLREKLGGMSADWITDAIRSSNFPAPIILSSRSDGRPAAVAWDVRQVDAWLDARRMQPYTAAGASGKTFVEPAITQPPKRRGRKALA